MSNTDYAKDLGMSTAQKTVPMPFVYAIIAAILVGGYFGFSSALKERAGEKTPVPSVASNK